MKYTIWLSGLVLCVAVGALIVTFAVTPWPALGQEQSARAEAARDAEVALEAAFSRQVQPLISEFCLRCHNADNMMSGIRLDQFRGMLDEGQMPLWKGVLRQLTDKAMPPEDEPQPTDEQRGAMVQWFEQATEVVRLRPTPKNGSVRRLTVSQYRNTLRDLLGLQEDLTDVLPPDALSKDGFANNGQTLELSPLQVEAYFDIAEKALDLCIVDEHSKPSIQDFRVDLGAAINTEPCPDNLILGAESMLLNNQDFVVTQLTPNKPFAYEPFYMRTAYEFIEGYVGNDTIRQWRKFDSIYHSVFACMRGTRGYPKGEPYQMVPEGLLLRPAIPSAEIFGQSSTYGPHANFKISLRELPEHGNFRITVKAARYADALLLDVGDPVADASSDVSMTAEELTAPSGAVVTIAAEGIYQVDVRFVPGDSPGTLRLNLGQRQFAGQLRPSPQPVANASSSDGDVQTAPLLLVRLPAGQLHVSAQYSDTARLRGLTFSRVAENSSAAARFQAFEQRVPWLGVHLGLRRDCGSTLTPVGDPRAVTADECQEFVFEGAINDFPSPDVEKNNVNYLAGIREIGVRSEYTDGRDMPRLLIRSVEFEGPYYDTWPPATHRNIFIESPHRDDPAAYARDVIRSFASRAFRRPVTAEEEAAIFAVWESAYAQSGDNVQSIKDALIVVLTSPQMLFLIESSSSPEPEPLNDFELASKLSYFLWNAPPDKRLLELAAAGTLSQTLDAEFDRMIADPQFGQFAHEFTSQWLSLDKFDVVQVDRARYPTLTRAAKTQLRQEPIEFLRYLIQENLPLRNLIRADFILANDAVASYYGLGERTEHGLKFMPVTHDRRTLGGVLTQASILAGLSDGRQSNPVKRGAWLARKIIAEPPEDPPPNVPQLPPDDTSQLTLRQRLERHRNQEGCVKCHEGIDPWGLPLEQFDAGGLWKQETTVDAASTLPDGTELDGFHDLQSYLTGPKMDQVAFSFARHVASYATGRSLTYNELALLREKILDLKPRDYRMQDILRLVIHSEMFLEK